MKSLTHTSKRLALSYVVDWIVIIGIAAVGAGFWKQTPNHRPFSPVDPDISFPYVEHEKISTGLLVTIALIIPAFVTAVVSLVFTPGPGLSQGTPTSRIWRMKLWEWNTAWMGLALGLATTFFFTEGLKNLIGRPRPDLLSRCNLDPANVQQYALGGEGSQLPLWNLLISSTACRQPSVSKLNDGFASFPSGHSSFSWAGMFYLTLFLCSKFSVTIPYLLPHMYTSSTRDLKGDDHDPVDGASDTTKPEDFASTQDASLPPRKQAAAPPTYLFILPIVCISIPTYVASTRFSDFRHHGFDVIFGALMGSIISYISFRMYHLPIRRGAGWSWGPRSASKAWGKSIGTQGYTNENGLVTKRRDLEAGNGPSNSALASSSEP
ncbi:MAG: hypothetical protein ASARMPREDX12_003063 [Alectoria sarmentosa]|nr:MAG: hypothetical protein ASARMPREDX12_003063 [Alectoria sarmentosa]